MKFARVGYFCSRVTLPWLVRGGEEIPNIWMYWDIPLRHFMALPLNHCKVETVFQITLAPENLKGRPAQRSERKAHDEDATWTFHVCPSCSATSPAASPPRRNLQDRSPRHTADMRERCGSNITSVRASSEHSATNRNQIEEGKSKTAQRPNKQSSRCNPNIQTWVNIWPYWL